MDWIGRLALVLVISASAHAAQTNFDFALIGDVPYTDDAATNTFPNMIAEINASNLVFVVHDGDIKSGSSPCTDEAFDSIFQRFQTFEHPLIYIFGDNEWQDCGGNKTNKFEPMERLQKLREIFTKGDQSLGKRTLKLARQSEDTEFSDFRENIRWVYGGVMFAGLNVPGNANDFGKPEFAARHRANMAWLHQAFRVASSENCIGLMLIIQANPHFDLASTNTLRAGFNEMISALEREAIEFKRPVVLVHGDSHYFRIDKPLVGNKSKRRLENFTRVETFGYPDVHWLRVHVDSSDPGVFTFFPQIVRKNLVNHEAADSNP